MISKQNKRTPQHHRKKISNFAIRSHSNHFPTVKKELVTVSKFIVYGSVGASVPTSCWQDSFHHAAQRYIGIGNPKLERDPFPASVETGCRQAQSCAVSIFSKYTLHSLTTVHVWLSSSLIFQPHPQQDCLMREILCFAVVKM